MSVSAQGTGSAQPDVARCVIILGTPVEEWDWSLRVFDHVDVHASDFSETVRFYETVLAPLGIPRLGEGADWVRLPELRRRRPATADDKPPPLLLRPLAEAGGRFPRGWRRGGLPVERSAGERKRRP
jgi:hypothetical protein